VNRDVRDVRQRLAVARVAGGGDGQRHVVEVDLDRADVLRVVVGVHEHRVDLLVGQAALGLEERTDRLTRLDDAGHQAALDRHVGQHRQLVHVPVVQARSAELNDGGVGRRLAPLLLAEVRVADEVQDQVLGRQHALGVALDHHADRLGHGDGNHAGAQGKGHRGRAHAESEGVEHPGGRRMAVGEHDDLTRVGVVLDHDPMADAGRQRATRSVQPQSVLLRRGDHLVAQAPGGDEPLVFDPVGDRLGVDEHEVVLERSDLLGALDGLVAPLLLVQRHHHAAGVLVHAAKARSAQYLVPGRDRGDAHRATLARPGAPRCDLLDAVHRAGGAVHLVGRLDLAGEQRGAVLHQPAALGDRLEERRQLVGERRQVDILAALQPVDHGEVRGEGQAAVDHILLEDALEAAGDDELDPCALVRDDGDLSAAAGAVGIAADDDLKASALDPVLDDGVLEVLEEVRAQNLAGVAERAGGPADHGVGVDPEVHGRGVDRR